MPADCTFHPSPLSWRSQETKKLSFCLLKGFTWYFSNTWSGGCVNVTFGGTCVFLEIFHNSHWSCKLALGDWIFVYFADLIFCTIHNFIGWAASLCNFHISIFPYFAIFCSISPCWVFSEIKDTPCSRKCLWWIRRNNVLCTNIFYSLKFFPGSFPIS